MSTSHNTVTLRTRAHHRRGYQEGRRDQAADEHRGCVRRRASAGVRAHARCVDRSVDIAQKKAWTSRAFDIETGTLGTLSQSGDQFFGIHVSNDGKVMIFAGGVPIKQDGKVIGAIGGSGGLGAQDQAVAEAGVAAL